MKLGVLAIAVMLVLTSVAAYGAPNIQRSTHEGRRNYSAYGRTGYAPSLLDSVSRQMSSWIYTGKIPEVYSILNLTDEQKTAIEGVIQEGKQARTDLGKEMREAYKNKNNEERRKLRQEQRGKMDEITKTYQKRIADLLTDEQKMLLKKFEDLAKEKRDLDISIQKAMGLALQKNRENYEEKLSKVLTPEQKELLEAKLANPYGTKIRSQNQGGDTAAKGTTHPKAHKTTPGRAPNVDAAH